MWVEQSYKQVNGSLGFADCQVRSDIAIRRHWQLVFCAFSFCWWAYVRNKRDTVTVDPVPEAQQAIETPESVGGKEEAEEASPPPSWPVALREVQGWLDPWIMLWRFWRAGADPTTPAALRALLDAVGSGRPLHLSFHV